MILKINADKCQGHGRCYALAPELFNLDENGNASVRVEQIGPDKAEHAELAVLNCPEQAITLEK